MENVTAVLQKNLTLLRRRAGLTQEQFAEKLGLSFQAVSKWENGLSCPDIALLPEIAAIYGVEIGQLFTPIDPENPPASREEDPAPDSAPDLGSAIDSLIRSVTHQVSQSIPSPKKMEFDFHWDNTPPPSFETALPVRVEGLPWEDDGVYRAVLFRGRSLVTPPAAEKGVLAVEEGRRAARCPALPLRRPRRRGRAGQRAALRLFGRLRQCRGRCPLRPGQSHLRQRGGRRPVLRIGHMRRSRGRRHPVRQCPMR